MARQLAALLSLAFLLLPLPDLLAHGHVAAVSVTVVVLLAAVLTIGGRDRLVSAGFPVARGPAEDERCLRGSFRRLCSPDTPGRLGRPRAPGEGHHPA